MKKLAAILCVSLGSLPVFGQNCMTVSSINQAGDGNLVINNQVGVRNTPANAAQIGAALQDQSLVVCLQSGDVVGMGREANGSTSSKTR